jgi:hypothetical protein
VSCCEVRSSSSPVHSGPARCTPALTTSSALPPSALVWCSAVCALVDACSPSVAACPDGCDMQPGRWLARARAGRASPEATRREAQCGPTAETSESRGNRPARREEERRSCIRWQASVSLLQYSSRWSYVGS